MKQYFKEDMDILCRKGFYPYEFIYSDDKLNYPGLPPKKTFYSKLYRLSFIPNIIYNIIIH
jgi:hypothetical protein